MYFQHVCTHNDRNGNPRRLFVLCLDGTRIASWDEGYMGHHCVPACLQKAALWAEHVDVPPSLYYELRKGLPSPDPEMLKVCATINGQLAAV